MVVELSPHWQISHYLSMAHRIALLGTRLPCLMHMMSIRNFPEDTCAQQAVTCPLDMQDHVGFFSILHEPHLQCRSWEFHRASCPFQMLPGV